MDLTLKDIGERELIEIIKSIITIEKTNYQIGDDCAIIPYDSKYFLVSTDMISQKTHLFSSMSYKDIGWFVTAINLSDIAAKGGTPLGILLAYGLPRDMNLSDFRKIVEGAKECASTYNTSIIGGDTKENTDIVITGTSLGIVEKGEFMSRAGAKPNDIIAVTGKLGKAAAGFLSIQDQIRAEINFSGITHPTPRIFEGRKLASTKKVHCCIDISDGLSTSLYELQRFNKVGFQIDFSKIPVDSLLNVVSDKQLLDDYLLHFGGEYELLVCISSDDFLKLQKLLAPTPFTAIGKVTKNRSINLLKNGKFFQLNNRGYEHFISQDFSKNI